MVHFSLEPFFGKLQNFKNYFNASLCILDTRKTMVEKIKEKIIRQTSKDASTKTPVKARTQSPALKKIKSQFLKHSPSTAKPVNSSPHSVSISSHSKSQTSSTTSVSLASCSTPKRTNASCPQLTMGKINNSFVDNCAGLTSLATQQPTFTSPVVTSSMTTVTAAINSSRPLGSPLTPPYTPPPRKSSVLTPDPPKAKSNFAGAFSAFLEKRHTIVDGATSSSSVKPRLNDEPTYVVTDGSVQQKKSIKPPGYQVDSIILQLNKNVSSSTANAVAGLTMLSQPQLNVQQQQKVVVSKQQVQQHLQSFEIQPNEFKQQQIAVIQYGQSQPNTFQYATLQPTTMKTQLFDLSNSGSSNLQWKTRIDNGKVIGYNEN